MRSAIREQIEKNEWGVELIGGGIGNIEPPDDIIQKRIEYWQAHWENLITLFETNAETKERIWTEYARAEAQRTLFLHLTDGLDSLENLNSEETDKLMLLNLLEALESEGVTNPDLKLQSGAPAGTMRHALGSEGPNHSTAGGGQ
jgi:hypothetical protein